VFPPAAEPPAVLVGAGALPPPHAASNAASADALTPSAAPRFNTSRRESRPVSAAA
jgi:hypothetical protein